MAWAWHILVLAVTVPNLWDPRCEEVFSIDYRDVVEKTPHIRSRAKLPRKLKWTIVAMTVALVGLGLLIRS
jgi:hypothetical protein